MVENQVKEHPPLLVCHPGHVPAMFLSSGNNAQLFHVECPLCRVRTAKYRTSQAAADAWTNRDVMQIVNRASAVAA